MDPWLNENDIFERWDHPRLGPVLSVRSYADFARSAGGFHRPTPDLGEHSTEVLAAFGVDPERVRKLYADGAVFDVSSMIGAEAKSARPGDGGSALATA